MMLNHEYSILNITAQPSAIFLCLGITTLAEKLVYRLKKKKKVNKTKNSINICLSVFFHKLIFLMFCCDLTQQAGKLHIAISSLLSDIVKRIRKRNVKKKKKNCSLG